MTLHTSLWEELDAEDKIWAYIVKDYVLKLYPREIIGSMTLGTVWDSLLTPEDRDKCMDKYKRVVSVMKGDE